MKEIKKALTYGKPFVEREPHFKLVEPFITSGTTYEAVNGNSYTPQEVLEMWEKANTEHWKNCATLENDNFQELILNFLVMLGVEIYE